MPRKKKGAALITVIMVFLVLAILGTAFISVNYANAMQVIRREKSIQAYHLARSGVEIGLKKLEKALSDVATAKKYYPDIEDLLNDTSVKSALADFNGTDGNGGAYSVKFMKSTELLQDEALKIYAEGTVGNVKNTTAITIKLLSPKANPKGWINNGWIIPDGYYFMNNEPVVFKTKKNLGHAVMKVGNNNVTVFKAPSIHFLDVAKGFSLAVNKNSERLTLEGNFITFREKVLIQNNGSGKLYLDVFADASGNRNGLMGSNGTTPLKLGYGVVYFPKGLWYGTESAPIQIPGSDGFYFFKGNSSMPGQELNLDVVTDRSNGTKMIKITDSTTIAYLQELLRNETNVTIRRDISYWSKE